MRGALQMNAAALADGAQDALRIQLTVHHRERERVATLCCRRDRTRRDTARRELRLGVLIEHDLRGTARDSELAERVEPNLADGHVLLERLDLQLRVQRLGARRA